ncbi:uncharacterized protein BKA78DRAFT_318345 [Phyllosticta capitalensis]|uniref:uncharacterized protein n=1 Tax=Phyllosticta capitalensis TaxID=121624 RepID=UPI00312D664F
MATTSVNLPPAFLPSVRDARASREPSVLCAPCGPSPPRYTMRALPLSPAYKRLPCPQPATAAPLKFSRAGIHANVNDFLVAFWPSPNLSSTRRSAADRGLNEWQMTAASPLPVLSWPTSPYEYVAVDSLQLQVNWRYIPMQLLRPLHRAVVYPDQKLRAAALSFVKH